MTILNKTMYPVAIALSVPLLMLGGCANNDTVKMTPDSALTVNDETQQTEVFNEQQIIEGYVSLAQQEETIEVIEPIESIVDEPVEETVSLKEMTPKPSKGIIGFAFDEADIDAQYGELLWQHAQYLKENKNLILNISGHTDSSGVRVYNEMLSKKRAEHVAKILMEFGVSEDRIKVTGNASDQPLAGAVNHHEHRRVELDYQDQQIVSN